MKKVEFFCAVARAEFRVQSYRSAASVSGECCQCGSVANVEVLPMPMLPVGNWGVGLVQSSEWLGLNWNWIVDSDNSMKRHCRTNDRGQKTKDWAGGRFAFNSHHPLSFVFCPLSLNSFAFAAGSFGVSESLRRFEDFF